MVLVLGEREISGRKASTTVQYGYLMALHRWQYIFTNRKEKIVLE